MDVPVVGAADGQRLQCHAGSLAEGHGRDHPRPTAPSSGCPAKTCAASSRGSSPATSTGALPVWAGLLTPQGKCLFDFMVWDDGDDLLLDCEAAAADDLIKRLSIYRLRRPITIERDQRSRCIGRRTASRACRPAPARTRQALARRRPAEPASGWLEHRLRLGVTEGRAELGDLLWLECNAAELNGVSFSKGCFVGQENTARMNWRQKVNRRLLVVEGDRRPRTASPIPSSGCRWSIAGSMRSRRMRSSPTGWRRSLSRARRRRGPGTSPCRAPSAARRRSGSPRRAGCRARHMLADRDAGAEQQVCTGRARTRVLSML